MMTDRADRTGRVREHRLAATTTKLYENCEGYVHAWARQHLPLPWSPEDASEFLLANAPAWTRGSAGQYVAAVERVHRQAGCESPVNSQVRQLFALLEQYGARSCEATPMAAITVAGLRQVVSGVQQAEPRRAVVLRRAYLVVAWWAGLPIFGGSFPALQGLTRTVVASLEPGCDTVMVPGASSPLRRSAHPIEVGVLEAARQALEQVDSDNPGAHYQAYNTVSRRLGMTSFAGAAPEPLQALSEEDRFWVLALLDTGLHDRRRDLAYMTLGIVAALRHHTLQGIDLLDVVPTTDGYDITLRHAKLRVEPRVLPVLHVSEDLNCTELCPACLIADLLEVTEKLFGSGNAPLFAEVHGSGRRAMNRQLGWRTVRLRWVQAGGDPAARVGTRSLRIGGVTSAFLDGWRRGEIMQLSDHRDPDTVMRYVRAPQDQATLHLLL